MQHRLVECNFHDLEIFTINSFHNIEFENYLHHIFNILLKKVEIEKNVLNEIGNSDMNNDWKRQLRISIVGPGLFTNYSFLFFPLNERNDHNLISLINLAAQKAWQKTINFYERWRKKFHKKSTVKKYIPHFNDFSFTKLD